MAKVTWRLANSPDDPIYSGKYVISSHNSPQGYRRLKANSPTVTTETGNSRTGEEFPSVDSPSEADSATGAEDKAFRSVLEGACKKPGSTEGASPVDALANDKSQQEENLTSPPKATLSPALRARRDKLLKLTRKSFLSMSSRPSKGIK